jgi:hypothetical protein
LIHESNKNYNSYIAISSSVAAKQHQSEAGTALKLGNNRQELQKYFNSATGLILFCCTAVKRI